jgi:phage/plasmid-like protein (TIGR03299 family)
MAAEFDSGLFVNANLRKEWHGLGQIVPTVPRSTQEAMQMAGMDWRVTESPVITIGDDDDAEPSLVEGWKCLRRSDNQSVLHVCKRSWTPVQNQDAFAWFDPIIADGDAEISAAVSLRGGRRIAITAKINDRLGDVVGGDPVESYLLLFNSHDGTLPLGFKFTNVRVVCQNTLNEATHDQHGNFGGDMVWDEKSARIRHTSSIHDNMAAVRDALDIQQRVFRYTLDQYRDMAKVDLSASAFNQYLATVFADDLQVDKDKVRPVTSLRHYDQLVANFESGVGATLPGVRGTAWAAYNAVTEWTSHQRGKDDVDAARKRLNNLWFGTGGKINQAAHQAALSLV